ncbi:MAG TPA: DUF255 domain-containing protein [Chromatiales bacterium]|nr:DUF255 domain-containing protein [Chromatiales bacterium]
MTRLSLVRRAALRLGIFGLVGMAAGLTLAGGTWTPLPDAPPVPKAIAQRLLQAYEAKGPDWKPRTEHLGPDGRPRYVNRLILEDSPYLLQHAHNPVDWHPWGAEALSLADRLDRPLFISIGYSTCHWCHVMERESFDDETIARELNAHFVPVKVDRERRPDVDELYMTAALLSAGHGGWPLSVFALPDGRPFYVTTYLPPDQFHALLQRIQTLWHSQRGELERAATALAGAVTKAMAAEREAAELDVGALSRRAVREILADYDEINGGFGTAPKFPEENRLLLLLDHVWRTGDQHVLDAVVHTLEAMAQGGVYDQVGGGFHRYATDPQWLVPHFEKMLYNQARLARVYVRAWQLTGRASLRRVAEQTLDYVLRDLRAPDGGLYSARDADSEGREGAYYLWTPQALREALGEADARLAMALFGVTPAGNFEGENILHLPQSLEEFATSRGWTLRETLRHYQRIRSRLLAWRAKRPAPHRDEKVITAWNGMAIAALAEAGRIFGGPCPEAHVEDRAAPAAGACGYLQAARRAAAFLLHAHRRGDRLLRLSLQGRPALDGRLPDYAWLIEGLLSLYDADADRRWLDAAEALARSMIRHFQDPDSGAFYLTAADADTPLFTRPRSPVDGALPSGDAVAVRVLARLTVRSGEPAFAEAAARALTAVAEPLRSSPVGFPYLLLSARHLVEGEVGPLRYAARGRVRLRGDLTPGQAPEGKLRVALRIAPGWHVNAHEPGVEDLVPTTVRLQQPGALAATGPMVYPRPLHKALRFAGRALSLYEGRAVVDVPVQGRRPDDGTLPLGRVVVQLQACSDEVCLAPERPTLTLPVWPLLGPLDP